MAERERREPRDYEVVVERLAEEGEDVHRETQAITERYTTDTY